MQPLTAEQQEDVVKNIGLVGCFISKYRPPAFIRMADYESELMLALCKAIATWAPGGAKISTWAFHKFMGARSDLIRRTLKFFRNEKQISEESFPDVAGPYHDPSTVFELNETQQCRLQEHLADLNDQERMLLSHDLNSREIAEIMGLSQQNVHHKRRVLLRRLSFKLRRVFPPQFRREHSMGNGGMAKTDADG